jgi:hypothetical protein
MSAYCLLVGNIYWINCKSKIIKNQIFLLILGINITFLSQYILGLVILLLPYFKGFSLPQFIIILQWRRLGVYIQWYLQDVSVCHMTEFH